MKISKTNQTLSEFLNNHGAFNFNKIPMKISKTHKTLSEILNAHKVLKKPGHFLGSNWKAILNFWLYIDTLSEEQKRNMNDRYLALGDHYKHATSPIARQDVSFKVEYAALNAAFYATNRRWVFSCATHELIAHHKHLERNISLVALPICLNQ
jgi:hypothetical protein